MGEFEIKNDDKASWVCKNRRGDIQTLIWDFTIPQTADRERNQVYYKRDIPAKYKETIQLNYSNIAAGRYMLSIVKVGYQSNDVYGTYMQMGSPKQLTKTQVQALNEINSGAAIVNEIIEVKNNQPFKYELPIRENDMLFINLVKL